VFSSQGPAVDFNPQLNPPLSTRAFGPTRVRRPLASYVRDFPTSEAAEVCGGGGGISDYVGDLLVHGAAGLLLRVHPHGPHHLDDRAGLAAEGVPAVVAAGARDPQGLPGRAAQLAAQDGTEEVHGGPTVPGEDQQQEVEDRDDARDDKHLMISAWFHPPKFDPLGYLS